jgi:hypothetical protein
MALRQKIINHGRRRKIRGKTPKIAGSASELAAVALEKTAAAEAGGFVGQEFPALLRGWAVGRFTGETLTINNPVIKLSSSTIAVSVNIGTV